jgi:mutator protein MutT
MTRQLVFQKPPENFNPKIEVAACFITVGEDVLFVKQQPRKEGGKWGIPGGKLEKGETAHQAAIREIKEETGLDLPQEIKHFGTVYIRYPEIDFIYHMYGHILTQIPEVVIDPREHEEYRWIRLEEALKLPLIPGEDECIYLVYPDLKISPADRSTFSSVTLNVLNGS